MLEYKTTWHGSQVGIAARVFPFTKTGSACGHVKAAMPLAARVFRCAVCGGRPTGT
jgi:putative transposase